MIDHILGRPSISWKRTQVLLVVVFWFWRILQGDKDGPRLFWIRRFNRFLKRFTPWQLIVGTLTSLYAIRNMDRVLGLAASNASSVHAAPEPLANLYSPSYYRATWISTGLDVGFATALPIKPRWLRDICSIFFSFYYIIYANEADEKLRKFRAVPTKTTNPYVAYHPRVNVRRRMVFIRPKDSSQRRPITAWLFFAPPAAQLCRATDLILDFPGGGFVSMTPEHHEERLRMWAIRTGKPVLSVEYGKAPEYPYPFCIDECFDIYRVLVETTGMVIGMSGQALNVILTGDSACRRTYAVTVMFKILETQMKLPHPLALMVNYAALDFNFTSWMSPRICASCRQNSLLGIYPFSRIRRTISAMVVFDKEDEGSTADVEDEPGDDVDDEDKPLKSRIRFNPEVDARSVTESPSPMNAQDSAAIPSPTIEARAPIGTRLTMTSRTGYFQDRIIPPSMMRAMAILYIGPHRNPDFQSDYQLSPILAPDHLLAQFPPLLMSCGEKDPFVDDTLIFAGRVREAKRARRAELERIIAGKSSQFGEQLRMSSSFREVGGGSDLRALRRERDRLASETEEDWVRMCLFSEWSHGYLQMPTLMPEVKGVIDNLADWMDDVFIRHEARTARKGSPQQAAGGVQRTRASPPRANGDSSRTSSHSTSTPDATDGFTSAATSETELDTDEVLSFSPRRRSPPDSSSGTLRRLPVDPARRPSESSKTHTQTAVAASGAHAIAHADASTPQPPQMGGFLDALSTKRSTSMPGTQGRGGQTISEVELMRRRRLLDAHLVS
ncbi:alpha/beta-hydrolase [Epithele typhae]|uniref:alpha/beta-hydrolase n=1 Tax=Epithele typhae TaxID=378194 RepID=UPI002008DA7E|nr:alpha/beta-hydrolase [Epithele typhae]KAH9931067.1 alpha/beta-hydrolase [Epithele typhae]